MIYKDGGRMHRACCGGDGSPTWPSLSRMHFSASLSLPLSLVNWTCEDTDRYTDKKDNSRSRQSNEENILLTLLT